MLFATKWVGCNLAIPKFSSYTDIPETPNYLVKEQRMPMISSHPATDTLKQAL